MKKLLIAIVLLGILCVAGYGGYRGYVKWKQNHRMKLARQFIAKSDAANAILCLRQVLGSNPNHAEACRLMADFAALARSPQAVAWRSRLVELEPNSLSNRLDLARAALAQGDAVLAQRTLDAVESDDKKTAVYHKVAGAVNLSAKRLAEAETHFVEAARLEPTNLVSQLNLATLRLQKTDQKESAEARAALQALSTNPAVRSEALRQLTLDALSRNQTSNALVLSTELLKQTNSVFGDRLLRLDILRAASSILQDPYLASLQRESATNALKTYEVAKWMLNTEQPRAALTWINSLAPATRTNLPVPMIESECLVAVQDWTCLQTNLETQYWLDLDFLRLAYRTRALKSLNLSTAAKEEWTRTMKAVGNQYERLNQLLYTVTAWKWTLEQEDILWVIVNRHPRQKWAFQTLSERLYTTGKTRSLLTLYSRASETEPGNLSFKNNLAMTALLLNSWDLKPHDLARAVYEKSPTNAAYASTYAFSLHLQDKSAEALKVLEQLSPKQLEDPGVSGYYGLILQASGNAAKARKYLDLATEAKLLPEEKKLIDQARRSI